MGPTILSGILKPEAEENRVAEAIKIADLTQSVQTGAWYPFPAGPVTVVVKGTFGGGTVTIEATDDDGANVLDLGDSADFTANGARTLELGIGMKIRAAISGGDNSEDIDVVIRPIK